jgi:DNA-binding NtrC family response regulator
MPLRELGTEKTGEWEETRMRAGGVLEVRLDQRLEETIELILRAALELEGGNRSRAARRLGISVRTMQRYASRVTPKANIVPPHTH